MRVVVACRLEQTEILSAANGRPALVDPKLVVNVTGVSTHGVQGHREFTGDFRSCQFGSEQPQHFKLTFAQWLDE